MSFYAFLMARICIINSEFKYRSSGLIGFPHVFFSSCSTRKHAFPKQYPTYRGYKNCTITSQIAHQCSSRTLVSDFAPINFEMVDTASLKKLKVTELRDQLSSRGLDTKGVKDELIARLAAALETEEQQPAAAGGQEQQQQAHIPAEAPSAAPTAPAVPAAAGAAGAEEKKEAFAPATAATTTAPPRAAAVDTTTTTVPAVPAAVPAPAAEVAKPALAEDDKKKIRAERFGLPAPTSTGKASGAGGEKADIGLSGEEMEKRKKRAERFGLPVPVFPEEEVAKKKARAERFGLPPTKEQLEEQKKARAERFGGAKAIAPGSAAAEAVKEAEELKKKLEERAKRFTAAPAAPAPAAADGAAAATT